MNPIAPFVRGGSQGDVEWCKAALPSYYMEEVANTYPAA